MKIDFMTLKQKKKKNKKSRTTNAQRKKEGKMKDMRTGLQQEAGDTGMDNTGKRTLQQWLQRSGMVGENVQRGVEGS